VILLGVDQGQSLGDPSRPCMVMNHTKRTTTWEGAKQFKETPRTPGVAYNRSRSMSCHRYQKRR